MDGDTEVNLFGTMGAGWAERIFARQMDSTTDTTTPRHTEQRNFFYILEIYVTIGSLT
jgi:hypothetical protein